MDVIRTAVSMLGLYDPGTAGGELLDINRMRATSITAKIGIIAAYFHRARQKGKDLPLVIRKDLGEALGAFPIFDERRGAEQGSGQDTLDVAYVLHADHGMNASTFSARVTIATLRVICGIPQSPRLSAPSRARSTVVRTRA